ncbi:MAG: hypothetical protein PVH03_01065 [Chloroflexota bacterium]|jgi:hypothetical protein
MMNLNLSLVANLALVLYVITTMLAMHSNLKARRKRLCRKPVYRRPLKLEGSG